MKDKFIEINIVENIFKDLIKAKCYKNKSTEYEVIKNLSDQYKEIILSSIYMNENNQNLGLYTIHRTLLEYGINICILTDEKYGALDEMLNIYFEYKIYLAALFANRLSLQKDELQQLEEYFINNYNLKNINEIHYRRELAGIKQTIKKLLIEYKLQNNEFDTYNYLSLISHPNIFSGSPTLEEEGRGILENIRISILMTIIYEINKVINSTGEFHKDYIKKKYLDTILLKI